MPNAHASRQRRKPTKNHKSECLMCKYRPPEGRKRGLYRNARGHRRNPTS